MKALSEVIEALSATLTWRLDGTMEARPGVVEAHCIAIEALAGVTEAIFGVVKAYSEAAKAKLFDFRMLKEINGKFLILCCSCSHCKDNIPKFETIFPVGERFIHPTIGLPILLQENRWTDLGIYK
jgi:hypothetical protein